MSFNNYSSQNCYYPPIQNGNTVISGNDGRNRPPKIALIPECQRLSATMCEEFFGLFDLDEKSEKDILDVYGNPIFKNDENFVVFQGQQLQTIVTDKREPQIILSGPITKPSEPKPFKEKRKRVQKFKKHFTPGQPCKQQTTNSIHEYIRNRSKSPKTPQTLPIPITPTTPNSNASSYENTFLLNTPQPQYHSSRSPSLSPSLSPLHSPSDFYSGSSASSSYCPQSYNCFSNIPENYHPQQQNSNNQLYPGNQWNYGNTDNQYYPPGNFYSTNVNYNSGNVYDRPF